MGVSSPRIVGRSHELEALSDALARAAAGEPGIVVVAGAAGVGKSRLIAEFSARARAIGARVLIGDCLELVGGGLPFGPLAAILRDVARTTTPQRLEEVLGPARAEFSRLVPEIAPATDPDLGADRGAADASDVDSSRAQARLFEHVLAVLGRLGSDAPTVIVLEDVHWIDPATRDLISFLAANLRAERVLLLLTTRSEHLPRTDPHAAWLAGLGRSPRTRTISLEPFSADETAVQLGEILGLPPDPALADVVHRRSEGNALFNEELLAAIQAGSPTLPAILSDALGAKIRGLPARSIEALTVAAIASRSFDERFLAAVLGGAEEDYLEPVREAVVGQVLLAGPASYRFRHGLFAEAIVADLTPGQRRSLHARIAAALEAQPQLAEGGPAWVAGEAADHWRAADRPTEAYRCALAAGLAASAMYAHEVAFERWEQALSTGERVRAADRRELLAAVGLDQPELLIRAAQGAALAEQHDRAVALAEEALLSPELREQPARAGVLRSDYARILWGAGRFERADEELREAVELVETGGTIAERARVMGRYATMLLWRGQLAEGIGVAREAVSSAREAGLQGVEVEALDALGIGLRITGQIDESIERLGEGREVAASSGSIEELLFVADSLAECLVDADRFDEAIAVAGRGGDDARRFGLDRMYGAMFRGNAGLALFHLGRWADADDMTAHGMEAGHGRVWGLSVRARILAALGRGDDARSALAALAAMFPEGLPDLARLEPALPGAELQLADGDLSGAVETVTSALDIEWPHVGLRLDLAAVGLRAAADLVGERRSRRDEAIVTLAVAAAERCVAEVATQRQILAGWHPPTPSKLATADLAEAEMARLRGGATPDQWATISIAFDRVPMPYQAAYARYREAEARLERAGVKAEAGDLLRAAYRSCVALGARPLAATIEGLARQARVDLAAPPEGPAGDATVVVAPSTPSTPPERRRDDLGLSAREIQVLELVAAGWTNGQIAEELYISPKTASVHVTHILDKLGASNRVEAAMIASRAGLLKAP